MEAYLTRDILDYTGTAEVTEDFELPEYQPEVRRTAGVRCSVTRDNGFLEEGRAEISGSVLYTVVYMAGEGGVASVPLYSPWQCSIPLPADGGLGVDDLYITTEPENVTCRITGPRKLTLSARVKVRCGAMGKMDCGMTGDEGEDGDTDGKHAAGKKQTDSPICRMTETPVLTMKTIRQTGSIEGETAGEGTVVTCQGSVRVGDVRRVPEGLAVTGECVVRLLVLGENGNYMPLRCRAAISETLPIPHKAAENGKEYHTVNGVCASLSVTNGQDGRIRWEMEYDLEGITMREGTAMRAIDGYSRQWEDIPQYRQTEAVTGGRCIRCQVSLSGEKTMTMEGAEGLQCIYGWGQGRFERGEVVSGGRYILHGTANCTLFLTGNGDLVTEEVTIPIRCEWDGGEREPGEGDEGEKEDFRCQFVIGDVTGHTDGTLLRVQAEAYGEGILLKRQNCTWLYRLDEQYDKPLPVEKPAIVVYTPDGDEDVWSVQKRYRTDTVTMVGGRYVVMR